MERPSHGNPLEVSARWTPQHLDVTDAPLLYAAPKAPWIDGFQKLRTRVVTDAGDRMARRREHTRAVVDPAEITVLPPLPPPPVRHDEPPLQSVFQEVWSRSRRVMRGRVAG